MSDKLFDFINTKSVPNDEETELIMLNTRNRAATFYDSEEFKNAYFNYLINKFKLDEKLTESKNNCQVVKAMNVLYLDGDWYFGDDIGVERYVPTCMNMAMLYLSAWLEELQARGYVDDETNTSEFYYFMFIPETFPEGKAGFHVFIFCNRSISIDIRLDMYKNIKNNLINNSSDEILRNIGVKNFNLSNEFEKLFDTAPLKTASLLLPFAQKSRESRTYRLVETTFNYDNLPPFFVIPVCHVKDSSGDDYIEVKSNVSELIDEESEVIDELLAEMDRNQIVKYSDFGIAGKVVAEFMSSLIYLSPNHKFWATISNNDERLSNVIKPLIQFICLNYFIERQGKLPDNSGDRFVHSLTRLMLPLLKMTVKNSDEKTQRATYASCYQHIKTYFNKYSQVKDIFKPEVSEFWRKYCRLSAKDKKNLEYEALCELKQIKKNFNKIVKNWSIFVDKIIIGGMTDEIKPFRERMNENDDPRRGMTFDDVLPEQVCVNASASIDESFYTRTLRLWSLMFIFVKFYNNNPIEESIRAVISAFIRYFIWLDKSIGNTRILIYNIKQTKPLRKYPYNQWLIDNDDGDALKTWIKSLYLQIILPELETVNKSLRIGALLGNLLNAQIIDESLNTKSIKPFKNFESDTKKLCDNILSSCSLEYYKEPKKLEPMDSPFFPMRNGLLEFLDNGEVKMHYDNYGRFMPAYTNVLWTDEYDKECPEFKTVSKMWEQIMPIKEERDYLLSIFASTLDGAISKDLLVIMFGTGGDGKTISNNAITGMLGAEGIAAHDMPIEENGKLEYTENPNGLGASMKTDAILTSNKGGASGHDSGGRSRLNGKRFCSVQEPDPNVSNGKLNCAEIKELTSGSSITAREIYKKSESFKPNCLITLQTNTLFAYTEDTDAIRRRISVIQFRSKFTTAINADKFDSLEFKFVANPQLSRQLTSNPKFWQASFYILLPYAKDLIKRGIKALSDIPRPESIQHTTNESFAQSNGLVGWMNANIIKSPGHVLWIPDVIKVINDAHNSERATMGGILNSMKQRDRKVEICNQLIGTYMGRIYKLRREFYNKLGSRIDRNFNMEIKDGESDESIKRRYFDEFAVNSMDAPGTLNDKSDLYILGFTFKTYDDAED